MNASVLVALLFICWIQDDSLSMFVKHACSINSRDSLAESIEEIQLLPSLSSLSWFLPPYFRSVCCWLRWSIGFLPALISVRKVLARMICVSIDVRDLLFRSMLGISSMYVMHLTWNSPTLSIDKWNKSATFLQVIWKINCTRAENRGSNALLYSKGIEKEN